MSKFEVGHYVKCLTTSHGGSFIKGNTYILKSIDKTMLWVVADEFGETNGWWVDHFQPSNGAPEQAEPKQTGGIKHDADKVDFALVPVHPHTEVARVWTFGKKKYDAWNWKKGFIWSRPYAAALRHIYAWARGESNDPETGMPHLAHAICCLMMLIEFEHKGIGEDDRQKEFDEFAEAKRLRAKQEELCAKYDELVYFDESSPYPPKPTPGQFLKRTSNKGNDNE